MASRFADAVEALDRALRDSTALRSWLRLRRWCGETVGIRTALRVSDRALLFESATEAIALFLAVAEQEGEAFPIHLPFSLSTVRHDAEAFELPVGSERMFVTEGERRSAYAQFLVAGFDRKTRFPTAAGDVLMFRGESLGKFRSLSPGSGDDSSNIVVHLATDRGVAVFKSYKRPAPGNREPLILGRLHRRAFPGVPRYLGELALGRGDDRLVLGVAMEHVDATDLFTWFTDTWQSAIGIPEASQDPDVEGESLDMAVALGDATAGLHVALIDRHPGPFRVETFTPEDAHAARKAALANLSTAMRKLRVPKEDTVPARVTAEGRTLLLDSRRRIEDSLRGLDATVGTPKSVTHGDLHLAQVLRRASDGDLLFIDFEGEPERPGRARFAKLPPLRDVAGMARSFSYAKHYVWRDLERGDPFSALRFFFTDRRPEAERLNAWASTVSQRFVDRYLAQSGLYRDVPSAEASRAVRGWMTEKALYELVYELKHRPANILIPIEGLLSLIRETEGPSPGPAGNPEKRV